MKYLNQNLFEKQIFEEYPLLKSEKEYDYIDENKDDVYIIKDIEKGQIFTFEDPGNNEDDEESA